MRAQAYTRARARTVTLACDVLVAARVYFDNFNDAGRHLAEPITTCRLIWNVNNGSRCDEPLKNADSTMGVRRIFSREGQAKN